MAKVTVKFTVEVAATMPEDAQADWEYILKLAGNVRRLTPTERRAGKPDARLDEAEAARLVLASHLEKLLKDPANLPRQFTAVHVS
jgi:hypothetical protein